MPHASPIKWILLFFFFSYVILSLMSFLFNLGVSFYTPVNLLTLSSTKTEW